MKVKTERDYIEKCRRRTEHIARNKKDKTEAKTFTPRPESMDRIQSKINRSTIRSKVHFRSKLNDRCTLVEKLERLKNRKDQSDE